MVHADALTAIRRFLSIQAQDFIEDCKECQAVTVTFSIPEHSSSGLH